MKLFQFTSTLGKQLTHTYILQFIYFLYKTISMEASSQICINDVILLCLMETPSHLFNKTEKLRDIVVPIIFFIYLTAYIV